MPHDFLSKLLLKWLGYRAATHSGEILQDGVSAPVEVLRDEWGIPHIYAGTDTDALFALGFCQGQDRAFQIELLTRVVRGTLSEWLGKEGVPIDRLSRRVGFRRAGQAQWKAQDAESQTWVGAFVKGVNAGIRTGLTKVPHEYALLRATPGLYEPQDVLGFLSLMSFLLPCNWDCELARLGILRAEGERALRALQGEPPPQASDREKEVWRAVMGDLDLFRNFAGQGGGSNNWVVSGERTKTKRPLFANDPHLAPVLPAHWYLAHVETPKWKVAGAVYAGSPAFAIGHNEHAAWGVTAGLVDCADLFLEKQGPQGGVMEGGKEIPCEVISETIRVKGGENIEEKVVLTPRGPLVGDGFFELNENLSLSATWLWPKSIRAMLRLHLSKTFDEMRATFDGWCGLSMNIAFAEKSGTIGWQLVGQPPKRKAGDGTLPLPAWKGGVGWESELHSYEDMPFIKNPPEGFWATANNRPETSLPVGQDFLSDDRVKRIRELLGERTDWDLEATRLLQLDQKSLLWERLKPSLLEIVQRHRELDWVSEEWTKWDGVVRSDSVAACLFELFLAEIARRVIEIKAPLAEKPANGQSYAGDLSGPNWFGLRRVQWISSILMEMQFGVFPDGWEIEIGRALVAVRDRLKKRVSRNKHNWTWGNARKLEIPHAMGKVRWLRKTFNRGPFPVGGDGNTVNQCEVDPRDLLANPVAIASLRFYVDVGNWDECYVVLPGGQSGNPFSKHYDDLLEKWKKGETVKLYWSRADVEAHTKAKLVLNKKD